MPRRGGAVVALLALAAAALALAPATTAGNPGAPAAGGAAAIDGRALYDRLCLPCHGATGDGRGPAAAHLWPPPRDFSRGEHKWRSTASGRPPAERDLAAAIRLGVAGTSMPPFEDVLDAGQIAALVEVVRGFAPARFARPAAAATLPGAPPAIDPARGAALWQELGCAACHGEGGRGDGPSAKNLANPDGRPAAIYDLGARPLRRPGAAAAVDARAAIVATLVTGVDGTPMPSFDGVDGDDLWQVAAHVEALRWRPGPGAPPAPDPTEVAPAAIAAARTARAPIGHWPGGGFPDEGAVFGGPIAPQGTPPRSLAPAQASLDPAQCARCHAKQVREWRGSIHAAAASPGLLAQLVEPVSGAMVRSCQTCHAPLAEQLPVSPPAAAPAADAGDPVLMSAPGPAPAAKEAWPRNPAFDPSLRAEGIACAACHLRGWERLGPPRAPGATLLPLPSYPWRPLAIYERADLCMGCHQLPPQTALEGKPLLNTYREWLEGPYMRRGVQCQHCHMPNREHEFKGVHDPDTFRQGIQLVARAVRGPSGAVTVRARLTNVGAAHYLPTTPTPAAWLAVELVDAGGRAVAGARAEKRIGRQLAFESGRFRQVEDTRIPPGESAELAAAWRDGAVGRATAARVTVRVAPDDYYEGFYRRALAGKPAAAARALYQQALERATGSHYVAIEQVVPIE